MPIQIHVRPALERDLATIRDLGAAGLTPIVEHLNATDVCPLSIEDLADLIAEVGDVEVAKTLARLALSLRGVMRESSASARDVIAGLRDGIEKNSNWDAEQLKQWDAAEADFAEFLSSHAAVVASKALSLSFDYANLLTNASVLTDVRPLFNDDASEIEASVVSYTLRLRFESVDGEHTLSLAMDDSDVHQLVSQCDRALRKASTARSTMQDKAGVTTRIAGEEKHG